jgi:hypothetical protein
MEASLPQPIAQALNDQAHTLGYLAKGKGAGAESARRKYLDALEEGGANEARTRREYFDRYPVELLQNAHDACADADVVGVARMVVTPNALLVANEGHPFDAERIHSLVTQGISEKTKDRIDDTRSDTKASAFPQFFN